MPIVQLATQAREEPSRPLKLLRFAAVRARTGLSRSTIWRLERQGAFPRHRRISANAVAWVEEEVNDWIRLKVGAIEPIRSAPDEPAFRAFAASEPLVQEAHSHPEKVRVRPQALDERLARLRSERERLPLAFSRLLLDDRVAVAR